MMIATVALLLLPPTPGWVETYDRYYDGDCFCSPIEVVLPDCPADATFVKVLISVESDWEFKIEGQVASDPWGYMSWDYQTRGRVPYASELGDEGDGYEEYAVYWDGRNDVMLCEHEVYFSVEKCVTTVGGYDPVGPADGCQDFDGSHGPNGCCDCAPTCTKTEGSGSGGQCDDNQDESTLGTACTQTNVLDALKDGDNLWLTGGIWSYNVMSTNTHGSFSSDQDIHVQVTWGNPGS